MKAKLTFLAVGLLLVGCGSSEPNVRIDSYNDSGPFYPSVRVEITALEDTVLIKNVVVNRGNCKVSLNYSTRTAPFEPAIELKYGDKLVTKTVGRACSVTQVDVETDTDE